MLRLQDICKEYRTGELIQKALDHVTLDFRDNEFVAILGPSGSGKTTLLNVIGGLDHYDSGDLIINGVSTKRYSDRNWDSYRNHTVGFVFQSYNLIPHQTILSNVALALTISGVSRRESRERAASALDKVGLGAQLHKKPNQLSGGQMQRVAIARALVNDPDILLADEPTGALDSETSIQVMELLREVAAEKLVIMVTHNPELASEYASRIVTLKDGVILSDSDPVRGLESASPIHKNLGHAAMSFGKAVGLSFNNLWTKYRRTLLVAFAGSIGITGIALVLALSNGVHQYIDKIEERTVAEYPLQIQSSSVDLASFLDRSRDEGDDELVTEQKTVSGLFSRTVTNDLASLRAYIEGTDKPLADCASAVEYQYSVVPQIFRLEVGGDGTETLCQVNPDQTLSALGLSLNLSDLLSASSYSLDVFSALPEDPARYYDKYEVKAGRWPDDPYECVLILGPGGSVTDLTLYALGFKDHGELDDMIRSFLAGERVTPDASVMAFDYDAFLGITFRIVNAADYYTFDRTHRVWADQQENEDYMLRLVQNGRELRIVGVVQPTDGTEEYGVLTSGIGYSPRLMDEMIVEAASRDIVRQQLADSDTDIITGQPFGTLNRNALDLLSLVSVDEDALRSAFLFDESAVSVDTSGLGLGEISADGLPVSNLGGELMDALSSEGMQDMDLSVLLSMVDITVTADQLQALFDRCFPAFLDHTADDPATDYATLPDALRAYFHTQDAVGLLRDELSGLLAQNAAQAIPDDYFQGLVAEVEGEYYAYAAENGYTGLLGLPSFYASQRDRLMAEKRQELIGMIRSMSFSDEQLREVLAALYEGYGAYAQANGLPDPARLGEAFSAWLHTDEAQALLREAAAELVDTSALSSYLYGQLEGMQSGITDTVEQAVVSALESSMAQLAGQIEASLASQLTELLTQLAGQLPNAISVDAEALMNAFTINMSEVELESLLTSLMSKAVTTYEGNLTKLGYADREHPSGILIYAADFKSKNRIIEILDQYNERMLDNGAEDKIVSYNDLVGTVMNSITDIINVISYVLIGFVAVSLVVSSIMIGVITYISVLERRKEIGILRALGASKHNIAQVFNAETFIIGVLAGLIGVGIGRILIFPCNALLHRLTSITDVSAYLPIYHGAILILLSVFLTLLGGVIPAHKAAKSDPVLALRSE